MADQVIDVHIHVGGKGNSSPCKMSETFLRSPAYLYMVVRSGIPLAVILEDHDRALRETLLQQLQSAPSVDFGVFLALDAVYTRRGEVDEKRSHMITPNDYVMEIARNNPKVLFGASVHPDRGEGPGTEELDRCVENGAVLVKWIPNSQIIDPSEKRHEWFYRKLADLRIPLLCHTGREQAVPVVRKEYQRLGDPKRLRLPLEMGVTVIAAHCATNFYPGEESHLHVLSALFEEAEKKGWKLYADISALCTLFRVSLIDDILRKIPHDKMILGSDYPVPVDTMPPYLVETLDAQEYLKISRIENSIEKNYRQLLAMGFPREAMTRASSILRIPPGKLAPSP